MNRNFESVDILGVRVDKITLDQTVEIVEEWMGSKEKHYIVTPNVEFIMKAQKDEGFRKVLNSADLAIPDSARFGWAEKMLAEKNVFKKLLLFPLFLTSPVFGFPVTTGSSLIYLLCEHFSKRYQERVVTVGLLGGEDMVAVKTKECLQKLYPGVKIVFASAGPEVDMEGNENEQFVVQVPCVDILFVAFGQVKQEKWIAKNLPQLPVKVAVGVGGTFNYVSGRVPRAPRWIRGLGFEWLFRLVLQPWRIKRFMSLIKFVFQVLLA